MLIGVTGRKGSGKDTFADQLGFSNVKMADSLKDMLRALFISMGTDPEPWIEGHLKETPCPLLCGKTPRHAMQTLGTEWRNMIGTDLWSNIWHSRVKLLLKAGKPVVCTDVRFDHEAKAIQELGGYMVRIERPGLTSGDLHVSETEMDDIPFDFLVINNGTTGDLQAKAYHLVRELPR